MSKREIERSRACKSRLHHPYYLDMDVCIAAVVSQLANLFADLESSDSQAVTPSLELAKLALVTSRDEEDDERQGRRGGTDSSTSTDATLVEVQSKASSMLQSQTGGNDAPSILGKRHRNSDLTRADSTNNSPPTTPNDFSMAASANEVTNNKPSPPPLPARKKNESAPTSQMMFGKSYAAGKRFLFNTLLSRQAA